MTIEDLFFNGFVLGLPLGVGIGIVFFIKTLKSNIDPSKSAWELCMSNIQALSTVDDNHTICKKHYENWKKAYFNYKAPRRNEKAKKRI